MVDRQDWVSWDNSMKAHIDQVEVKWKNDAVIAMERQAEINRSIHSFNDTVVVAVEDLYAEQRTTKRMIALCGVLMALNFVVGSIALMEALR